jgi:hypothetical protein
MPTWGNESTLTTTNLQSLASSATAGWGSAAIDWSTFEDYQFQVCLDPANTAPGSSRGFFVFVWGASNSSDYPTTGAATGGTAGVEGALTFPDITTTPNNLARAAFISYAVADVPQKGITFSAREALRMPRLPSWGGIAILNHSGAALAASGNSVKGRGLY